ncbi:coniferyl-alcohol dehydrogenase [Marinomonas posidonica]|uniref:NAD-dependent epimerase/dehydratase n=1 Tax=Marinomonas posidonica (strain CECT 7376 / NCIMB 14433 / IVIA-Po-181) TaxID=491952 RepID=F6CRZ3_MARPP|nr:coniferyl-alcohol dehydrogenase [Marinomonas posidonica]AEF56100.1 NAD-dependent epimerase/dehydratase [Marinomonas posidonica IVIA-Po-181]
MMLANKTIVVTGVSSGIGADVAKLARFHGAKVIGMDRNEASLTLDGFIQIDLGDPDAIDQAIKQLPDQIDGLCNIAGVPGTSQADLVGRVNYLGLRHLTQSLIPQFSQGASVVNVASILGAAWPERLVEHKELAAIEHYDDGAKWLAKHPVEQETCYQYFKEALIVWTTQQALAWFRDHAIRMNCVAPGPVMTPILGDFVSMLGEKRVQEDAGRMIRPAYSDEVAEVIAFLCSDQSRWVCGANIPIDGGLASTYI